MQNHIPQAAVSELHQKAIVMLHVCKQIMLAFQIKIKSNRIEKSFELIFGLTLGAFIITFLTSVELKALVNIVFS